MSDRDMRAAALGRLPIAYSRALQMREAGASDESIAEALGVECVAVGPLLRIAEAKLDALLGNRSEDREVEA